jgi:protein-L-isoaspartate(D-aspartate) O-methyltransferase
MLEVTGYGPHAAELAAGLVAHVQAWDQAGQPGAGGLHVDAYPRSSGAGPAPAHDGLLIERPSMRFVVYHA